LRICFFSGSDFWVWIKEGNGKKMTACFAETPFSRKSPKIKKAKNAILMKTAFIVFEIVFEIM
jgi:hypothetical protein